MEVVGALEEVAQRVDAAVLGEVLHRHEVLDVGLEGFPQTRPPLGYGLWISVVISRLRAWK